MFLNNSCGKKYITCYTPKKKEKKGMATSLIHDNMLKIFNYIRINDLDYWFRGGLSFGVFVNKFINNKRIRTACAKKVLNNVQVAKIYREYIDSHMYLLQQYQNSMDDQSPYKSYSKTLGGGLHKSRGARRKTKRMKRKGKSSRSKR